MRERLTVNHLWAALCIVAAVSFTFRNQEADMVTYEVRVEVEPYLAEAFQRYMQLKHIPEILATGCFQAIAFEGAGDGHFRTRYQAANQMDLDHYLDRYTETFRDDLKRNFPEGVNARRETWESLQEWGR